MLTAWRSAPLGPLRSAASRRLGERRSVGLRDSDDRSTVSLVSADVEVAQRLNAALDAAFETGDRESVYAMFADDIEYTTSHRTLRGLSEVREKLKWGSTEKENLDVDYEPGDWQDLGGGHVVSESRMVQRWKENGEVAAVMRIHVDLTIRDGQITRLERLARPE